MMLMRRHLVALLCAAPLLLAQSPGLSGTVFNAAYAEVKLMQGAEERARTSAGGDGEYAFRGVAGGDYQLVVNSWWSTGGGWSMSPCEIRCRCSIYTTGRQRQG